MAKDKFTKLYCIHHLLIFFLSHIKTIHTCFFLFRFALFYLFIYYRTKIMLPCLSRVVYGAFASKALKDVNKHTLVLIVVILDLHCTACGQFTDRPWSNAYMFYSVRPSINYTLLKSISTMFLKTQRDTLRRYINILFSTNCYIGE